MNTDDLIPNTIAIFLSALLNTAFYAMYRIGTEQTRTKRSCDMRSGCLNAVTWLVSRLYIFIAATLVLLPMFPEVITAPVEEYTYEFNADIYFTLIFPLYLLSWGGYWIYRKKFRT